MAEGDLLRAGRTLLGMGHESDEPTSDRPVRRHRRRLWLLVGAALAVATAAVLGFALTSTTDPDGLNALAHRDPNGGRACRRLSEWLHNRSGANGLDISVALGPIAAQATTERIRATVGEPVDLSILRANGGYQGGDLQLANLAQLRQACWTEGVKLPEYV